MCKNNKVYEDSLGESGCCKATHDEICDKALEHYEDLARQCHHWSSTVIHAIEFYKKYGGEIEPITEETLDFTEIDEVFSKQKKIKNVIKFVAPKNDEHHCTFDGHNFRECKNFIGDLTDNTLNYPNIITPEGVVRIGAYETIVKDENGNLSKYDSRIDIFATARNNPHIIRDEIDKEILKELRKEILEDVEKCKKKMEKINGS